MAVHGGPQDPVGDRAQQLRPVAEVPVQAGGVRPQFGGEGSRGSSGTTAAARLPAPDFDTITTEELLTHRKAENRCRAPAAARAILGESDPDAAIAWQELALPGRDLPVRVYRPAAGRSAVLPLVVQRPRQRVRGDGGAVRPDQRPRRRPTARAGRLGRAPPPRPDSPLTDAADDGLDVLDHLLRHADEWGVDEWDADPSRTAVFSESCGALIGALTAIRARRAGSELRAQVLVNPVVDVTGAAFDHPSMAAHAATPTLTLPQLRLVRRFAAPPGVDTVAVSPLHAADLCGLAPVPVVVPTRDPVADHGRRYAEPSGCGRRGAPTRLSEDPGAGHAFLTLPGLEP
ncbi:alpha/beta hydrolase fold domain-containing protein [Kitasatospora sp. CB02891]|uniref:alpha/beta hydrolase fold domain-containing protein n=1 Tax=Kitasatospora sp. CB02891 TaxID=2020329 RepID=UPI003517AA9A